MTAPARYPLQWPVGWKRTPAEQRDSGRFGTTRQVHSWRSKENITIAQAVQRLLGELERMGIPEHDIVVSTNLRTRLDGLPRSDQAQPADPGVAVYWRDTLAAGGPQDRCMAIDRYTKVEQNIAALAATIEAMRAIERHGGAAILNRAFTGFAALPAPIVAGMHRHWREVLDLREGTLNGATGHMGAVTVADVQRKYQRLAANYHPDRGGDLAKMAELNVARDEALKELQA